MNILHTLYQPQWGGGTLQVVQDLAAAARGQGHHVEILTRDSIAFQKPGIEPFFSGNKLKDIWRLWQRLHRLPWDLIHIHDRYCALLLRSLPLRLPSIQTCHFAYDTHRSLTPFADMVVSCSRAMDQHYADFFHLPASRRAFIANGVTTRDPDPVRIAQLQRDLPETLQQRQLCLTVGRLETQKGHTYLLQAIAELPRQVRQAWGFIWAGDGTLAPTLQHQAQTLGIANDILWLGVSHAIPEWLALADAFVLPSLYEGLPLALLEAMSTGIPILATAVGGNRDVIENGHNGLLCHLPTETRHQALPTLSQGLQRLLTQPFLRQRLGAQAKGDYLQFWTFERTWHQYEQLYHRLAHSQLAAV